MRRFVAGRMALDLTAAAGARQPAPMSLAPALLPQALALLRAGRAADARALLDRLLAQAPRNADALQLAGIARRQEGDAEGAVALFRRSLAVTPAQPHVCRNLGNALRALGRHDEAVAAYAAALRLDGGDVEARIGMGLAELDGGDAAAARAALEAAAQGSDDARAWAALGRACRALDDLPAAVAAFTRSLALRPGHLATVHNLAVALRLDGRPDDALPLLEDCARAAPDTPEILYNLGHCLQDLGRFDAAAAAYRAALARRPDDRAVHDTLNRMLWQQGAIDQYLASYREAITAGRATPGLVADFALRLSLEGRLQEAEAWLVRALDAGPDPALLHRLAQIRWETDRRDAAFAALDQALALDPAAKDARLDLARYAIIAGALDRADAAVGRLLERDPDDQQAIAYQGLVWRFRGDPREAWLNDYDRFVHAELLEPPEGDIAGFNAALEALLASLHRGQRHPLEQTLRGGTQTMGTLFARREPLIGTVRAMIEAAVHRYVAALPADPAHPLLRRARPEIRFAGSWSVRLQSAGFHLNHVHSEGWISACYYVGVPDCVAGASGHQGWLKLGETGLGLGARERIARLEQPRPGKLVLFPSYMYHGTIPFADARCRTTIAFDVVPG